jgi:hypothetical protein
VASEITNTGLQKASKAYFFFFGGAFLACARSEAATVFWTLVDFLLASSFPASFAGFFPVVMDLFPLPH